jgi:hypothetical protein
LDDVCIDWQPASVHSLFNFKKIIKKEESM